MARDKLDEAIIELLRDVKIIPLDDAKQKLVERKLGKPETVRKRFADLDGSVLKKVKQGRGYVLYEMDFFRRQGAITLEVRIAHTRRLRPLLDQFLGEIPVIDDRRVQPAKNGAAPLVVGATPERYDPRKPMDSEREALFADLMWHLDLIEPASRPAMSSRLAAFKDQVADLQKAQGALWDACKKWASTRLGLTYSDQWIDHGFSETFPRYLYDHALSAYRRDKRPAEFSERVAEFLVEPRAVSVQRAGNRIEVGWGAEGLFQHRVARGVSQQQLKKKAERLIAQLPQVGASQEFEGLAEKVDTELRKATEMRAAIISKLREAREFEAYEGACRFLLPAQ